MNLYILIGGKGSRLGQDKPSLQVGGVSILHRSVTALGGLFDRVVLVGGEAQRAQQLGLAHLTDSTDTSGPLAGIAASLLHANDEAAFVMASDMPFVSRSLVQHMLTQWSKSDALIPTHDGFVEPLFAIYGPSCLAAVRSTIKRGERKVSSLYRDICWQPLPESDIRAFGHPGVLFLNVNFDRDLVSARRLAGPHRQGVLNDGETTVPVFCVTGWSGSGKTHLASRLVQWYGQRGLRVAAVKHAAGGFELDRPGSDTAEFTAKGAQTVAVVGRGRWALLEKENMSLEAVIKRLRSVDLVIAEGFTGEGWPQLEVIGEETELRTPTALGFVGRGQVEDAPFPFFSVDELPMIVAHLDMILGINRSGGDKSWSI